MHKCLSLWNLNILILIYRWITAASAEKPVLWMIFENIYRPNPVTVVEMYILPPKALDIVKCIFIQPEANYLLFCFLLTPHFPRVLNESHWIQNDTLILLKWLSLCVYVWFFFLCFMINKNFRVSQVYLYGLECASYCCALLVILQWDFMIFGYFSCQSYFSCLRGGPSSHPALNTHSLSAPAFSLPLQSYPHGGAAEQREICSLC